MNLKINQEFKNICKEIINENKSLKEWEEIESDDLFQSQSFCGGFDGTENEFCFSFYDNENKEWWFQLPIEEVQIIAKGQLTSLQLTEAIS